MKQPPPLEWIPGQGPREEVLQRMKRRFPKPTFPLQESWHMGETIKEYTELLDKPINEISASYLSKCLEEITSWETCHCDERMRPWFKYLLPYVIERNHEHLVFGSLLEQAVTGCLVIYQEGLREEYPGFQHDFINSLFHCLMKKEWWCDGKHKEEPHHAYLVALFLQNKGYDENQPNEETSAMLFFGLKFLKPEEIPIWVKSLFQIKDPNWKNNFRIWFKSAEAILRQPESLAGKLEEAVPAISWHYSHSLVQLHPHLPKENCVVFLKEVKKHHNDGR